MSILHASLPADDPRAAAETLAKILGGPVMPFPPGGPGSFMVWSADGSIELELTRRGEDMIFGPDEAQWVAANDHGRRSDTHLAISVAIGKDEILAAAQATGWPARHCWRGGDVFDLVEVWVDGVNLIEFLDPEQSQRYRERITPDGWRAFLAAVEAGLAA